MIQPLGQVCLLIILYRYLDRLNSNFYFIIKFFFLGWLTLGPGLTNSNFNLETYLSYFDGNTGHLTGCTERIETLRPKSPQRQNNLRNNNTPVNLNKPRINRPPIVNIRPIN